jgi:hypothetical protein
MLRHGFGNIAQSAIAATGNDVSIPCRQRFAHQSLRIASFPGQSNSQLPTLLTPAFDSGANRLVECLFAVQNQQCLAIAHQFTPGLDAIWEMLTAKARLKVADNRIISIRTVLIATQQDFSYKT